MNATTNQTVGNSVGETVRIYREQFGLSQTKLAERVRTTATTIWRIENGRQMPGCKVAPGLARVLGIDLRYLLAG